MAAIFNATLRALAIVAGLGFLYAFLFLQDPAEAVQSLGANGPSVLTLIVRATRLLAIALLGPALVVLGARPAWWRAALIPILWAIVATIMIDPREFDFLF